MSGPGLRLYRDRLPAAIHPLEEARWDPQVEGLLQLARQRWAGGEHDDPWAVEPLYLRPSSAEEQWQRRSG